MQDPNWLDRQAQLSLERLLPRIEPVVRAGQADFDVFAARLRRQFPRIFGHLYRLYNGRYDFFYHLEQILHTTASMYVARSAELHALDARREAETLLAQ